MSKARIGIDTTPLPPQPVGAGNYILQLIRALALLPVEHEIVVIASQSGYQLIGAPSNPSIPWEIVPDSSPARRLIWEQTGLPSMASHLKLDLLHSLHYTRPLRLPCASVVTFHDMTFLLFPHLHTRVKRTVFPYFIRYSARHADMLIADSESTRQDSIRLLGLDPQRIQTVLLGVTPEYKPISDASQLDSVAQKYKLPSSFLLYLGLVEPRKNIPQLLSAYASARKNADLPDMVIAGRFGWMVEEVFQIVQDLGIQSHVHFPGYIASADLPMVYNLAELFIYPSLYEGFGFPPLEAMACGTPVITSAVSSMVEVVGDAGITLPPGDETALTEAIASLWSSRDLQSDLRRRGLDRAKQFTWERTARETLKVYNQVLRKL